MSARPQLRWIAPLLALAGLAAWEWASRTGRVSEVFYPAPSLILAKLAEISRNGELSRHLAATLGRVTLAFALGGGVGLVLGVAMGWSSRLRAVVDPFVAALHPVPKIALLPLILLVFGIGFFSKVIAVAVASFFPMVINATAGVSQLDPNYLDVARVYGASRWRTFWRVVVPGSLPTILAGGRLAAIRALGATVGLELITAQDGIGSLLFRAWQTYRTEELYGAIFLLGALGYGFRATVDMLTARLVPWQRSSRPR